MVYVGIALLILLILLVLMLGISIYLVVYAMKNMHHHPLEDSRAWQEHHYSLSWYDSMEKTDYTVTCGDGYVLHAQFLPNPKPTDRYVLITHGFTDNRYGSLKYAPIYLDNGFNVIIYDLRGHGMNQKAITTFTVREREDLYTMILDSRRRYPDMKVLGLHGESMGAGTTVAVLGKKPPVDFAVADCGFTDMVPVFEVAIRSYHLPVFMVKVASMCAKAIYGVSFSQMRPIESLRENHVPMLFMHGACDELVAPEHSRQMSKATQGYSEVHLIPNAGHADSVFTDPEMYRIILTNFLRKIVPDPAHTAG